MRAAQVLCVCVTGAFCCGAVAYEHVDIRCAPKLPDMTYVQKGDFAIAVPKGFEERAVESPDSNVWVWTDGQSVLSADFGLGGARYAGLGVSTPCNGGSGRLVANKKSGEGVYVVVFIPEYSKSLRVTFRVHGGLTRHIQQILSSFTWVGDLSVLKLVDTDPSKGSAVVVNETGDKFSVRIGERATRNFGVLREVRDGAVVVEQYVYSTDGGFRREIVILGVR